MNNTNSITRLLVFLATVAIVLSFSAPVLAVDDGARAYWNMREGTTAVSFQRLRLDMNASGSKQFDPGQYIYANANVEADIVIATWVRHMTTFNRASSVALNIVSGNVDAQFDADVQGQFLPPGQTPGKEFNQSASGYGDPAVQYVVNLYGTPALRSGVDLLNYEPTWTVDTAVMLALPVGEYENDKLVNMGLNRFYGRLALPVKYHFGVFDFGNMSSLELIPSVWLFDANTDFMGQELENDPMWQLEGHLTHDFTRSFFGSLDMLYRKGFQSKINGVEIGDELEIGNLGFTLNFQATQNLIVRTSYSSNVFGDDALDTSMIRMQVAYAWHPVNQAIDRLMSGHR